MDRGLKTLVMFLLCSCTPAEQAAIVDCSKCATDITVIASGAEAQTMCKYKAYPKGARDAGE